MGTTTQKIIQLRNTKKEIVDKTINLFGEEVKSETFREVVNHYNTLYNELPKVENEGNNITLENTRKGKVISLPEGNTKQESTTGKQLFDIDGTNTGLTPIQKYNNGFSLTKGSNRVLGLALPKPIPSGDYYFNFDLINTNITNTDNFKVFFRKTDNTNVAVITPLADKNVHIEEECTRLYIIIVSSEVDEATITVDNVMLNSGSSASPYEPYTGGQPSPNPEYPQDIKVVTGKNKVVYKGKNLLSLNNNIRTLANGVSLIADSIQPNSFRISGKSAWGNYVFMFNNEKNNIGYTLSARFKSTAATTIGIIVYGTDVLQYASSDLTSLGGIANISASANTAYNLNIDFNSGSYKYLAFRFWNNATSTVLEENTDMLIDNIQLETGSVATNYEPYIEPKEFDLDLSSKNKYYTKENGYISNTNGSITTTAGNVAISSDFIKIQKNASFIYYYGENLSSNINNIYANRVAFYDKDKNWITRKNIQSISEISKIAIESEAVYIKASFSSAVENPMIAFEETEYEPYYNYELYEEGTITKEDDGFYINNKYKKRILDGSENWAKANTSYNVFTIGDIDVGDYNSSFANKYKFTSVHSLISQSMNNYEFGYNTTKILNIRDERFTTVNDFKTELGLNNLVLIYPTEIPTKTEITDTTLINQLEDLNRTIIPGGTIVIETESEEENAPLIVKSSALKDWEVE